MPHVLIDGDEVLFKAASVCEEEVRWDEENHVLYSNEEKTWRLVAASIERLLARFGGKQDGETICFSGQQPYFRDAVSQGYKAGRSRKPLCYAAVKERILNLYHCKEVAGLEADDCMGILATKPGSSASVICSQDKDMKTIPACIWNGEHLITYTEDEADYWHLYQTLVGDKVDGYSGCPGVGPIKAEKLLSFQGEPLRGEVAWPKVVAAYEKSGLSEEHALIQARLARILRWSDWDNRRNKPILWTPTTTKTSTKAE